MKKSRSAGLVLILLAGCGATTSPIVPYAKDTYILNTKDTWALTNSSDLLIKAVQDANAYCEKMGKVIQVQNSETRGQAGFTQTSAGLVFACLDKNDPDNRRAAMQKDPDAVIQIRK